MVSSNYVQFMQLKGMPKI